MWDWPFECVFVCFANRVALYEGTLAVLAFCFGVCYFVLRVPYKEQCGIERVDMWMTSYRNALNRLIRHLVGRHETISYFIPIILKKIRKREKPRRLQQTNMPYICKKVPKNICYLFYFYYICSRRDMCLINMSNTRKHIEP